MPKNAGALLLVVSVLFGCDSGEEAGSGAPSGPEGAGGAGPECRVTADCRVPRVCAGGSCVLPDGGGGSGGAPGCRAARDCRAGYECAAGECVPAPECRTAADCPLGETCSQQNCIPAVSGPECVRDSECPVREVCIDEVCVPEAVNIYIVGALVGPGKSNGYGWDWDGELPGWVWEGLAAQMGVPGYGAVFEYMADVAFDAWEKPDPFGVGAISVDGQTWVEGAEISLDVQQDTYLAEWPGSPGWVQAPVGYGLAVGLDHYDEDIAAHDPIGYVQLDYWVLLAALELGDLAYYRVDDQTDGQLLYVFLYVEPAG